MIQQGVYRQSLNTSQAGMLTLRQGRRLLDFPDLEAEENLDNAREEYLLYNIRKDY